MTGDARTQAVTIVVGLLALPACDQAKPGLDRCVQLEATGDMVAAAEACWTVIPDHPKSKSEKAAFEEANEIKMTLKVNPEEIDHLLLKGRGREDVSFERRGDQWMWVSPLPERPADAFNLGQILTDLHDMKLEHPVSVDSKFWSALSTGTDVLPPEAIHAVAKRGAITVADVWLGAFSSSAVNVKVGASSIRWRANCHSWDQVTGAPEKYLVGKFPHDSSWKAATSIHGDPVAVAVEACKSNCENMWTTCEAAALVSGHNANPCLSTLEQCNLECVK